jgi:hypothetical protein
MSKKTRRFFTTEQKAKAVNIVQQSGKPVSQVARELGLTESALRQWVKHPLYVESSSVRPYSLGMWPSHNPWASKAQRYDSSPETSKNRRVPLGDRIAQG